MVEYYTLIKSLHIISVISWMAGMLYLPRLYVYHVDVKRGSDLDKTLIIMEKKLLRIIINPAMVASLIFGVLLIMITSAFDPVNGLWMHVKSLLLVFMFAAHVLMAKYRKDFEKGENKKSQRFFRIFNEVPTILMIFIVIIVVMKPF